uniref:THO complex subunit 5 n=1 Tax=Rhipicephalus zambeziensis TaxID=60191 RepID=A0A224Z0V2_9ACAR
MSRDKKVKRSKTANDVSNSGSGPNLHMDYFLIEEEESKTRDPQDDEAVFRRICGEIQANMKKILEMKLQRRPMADIEKLRVETSLLFLGLKKINRLDKHRLKVAKDAVNEKKQKVDNFHLQLQNLTYEVMHLQKEVTKCMEFRSRDEEIDLVPVEEFRREAPAEVLKKDLTDADPHQLTLARLQWELVQRKELSQKLRGLESLREQYEREIERKRECLSGIQPTLQAVLEAAQPLQADLGLPLQAHQGEHANAQYLSRPLYVLYVQAAAYQHAYGDCFEVGMEGSVEESKALLETTQEKQEEDSGESDQEESNAGKRHRRLTRSGTGLSSVAKCLQKHPLTVVITLQHKGYSLQITFTYIIALHIVTVTAKVTEPHGVSSGVSASPVMSPSTILDNLFGDDNGLCSPNPGNHFQLKKNGLEDFSKVVAEVGKAYRWAQRLAGLEFLQGSGASVVANHEVGRAFVEEFAHAIAARFAARVGLYDQLLSLEKGLVQVPADMASHFPSKVNSTLKQWTQVTHADVESHPSHKEMEELGLIRGDELVYQAVLRRGSAMVKALVLLRDNYPREAPLFLLVLQLREECSSRDDDAVKELERELNLHCVEQEQVQAGDQLLSCQLQQLLVSMDILLESLCDQLDAPREFSRDKVLARTARGPGRSRPYKFLPKPGIFTQRT